MDFEFIHSDRYPQLFSKFIYLLYLFKFQNNPMEKDALKQDIFKIILIFYFIDKKMTTKVWNKKFLNANYIKDCCAFNIKMLSANFEGMLYWYSAIYSLQMIERKNALEVLLMILNWETEKFNGDSFFSCNTYNNLL